MRRNQCFYISAFILLSVASIAQNTTVRAKKIKWNISVVSTDTVLWIDKENILQITVEGGSNYLIDIKDAKWKAAGNKYLVKVFDEGATTITVFEKLPNNKMKPVYTKLYKVKRIPDPVPYVCGVKADSVIDKEQLINENNLTAINPLNKKAVPVKGFDLIFSYADQSDTLRSTDNHFTLAMKRRIYYLAPGSMLYFDNVYCSMPDGKVHKLQPIEIYIDETNKYKVGYRLISGNN